MKSKFSKWRFIVLLFLIFTLMVSVSQMSGHGVLRAKAMSGQSRQDELAAYIFVHFIGNQSTPNEEQVYFSVSKDAHNWITLNNKRPVLSSTIGEKGVRDMCIVRSPEGGKFYIIATDLNMYLNHNRYDWGHASSNGSDSVIIWESDNLVDWSEARRVKVAPEGAGTVWAPEAIWDEKEHAFMLYWSSNTYEGTSSRQFKIYRAYTKDFKSFTKPELFMSNGDKEVIDSHIIKSTADNKYYRFAKLNGSVTGEVCKTDYISANDADWERTGLVIGNSEGPTAFQFNGEEKWGLFVDSDEKYMLYTTDDLSAGNFTREQFQTEQGLRHGTIMPITQAEYDALMEKYDIEIQDPADKKELLHYNFLQSSEEILEDVSGNGNNGTILGGADVREGRITFDGVNDYVTMPAGLLQECNSTTIAVNIKPSEERKNVFAWTFGNSSENGYIFMNPANPSGYLRTAVTLGDYRGENGIDIGSLPINQWTSVIVTWKGTDAKVYVNGTLKESGNFGYFPSDLGRTVQNYLAKSQYGADGYFKGQMSDFRVYNYALSSEEVKELSDMHAAENMTDGGMKITAIYDRQGSLKEKKVEYFEKGIKIDSPPLHAEEAAKIFIWDEKQRPIMHAFTFH